MNRFSKLSRMTERMVWVLMAIDIMLMVALPWLVTTITVQEPGGKMYGDYLIIMYTSGVFAELVLWQCRGIMNNVNNGKAFSHNTVHRLQIIGGIVLILAALYFLFIIFLGVFKFFMALLLVVFAFIGLILFIFSQLFREATAYKEENDMTI
ncbi:MAG: DUF2975 domain-containing protein [Clostridia bacterium]|nr:DUF2975 domain-containing protein [Clostridia bacterium]